MIVFLWVVAAILLAALMAFTTWASIVGGMAAATDCRYERCPRCGQHGLVHDGSLHDHGCPERHSSLTALRAHWAPPGHP